MAFIVRPVWMAKLPRLVHERARRSVARSENSRATDERNSKSDGENSSKHFEPRAAMDACKISARPSCARAFPQSDALRHALHRRRPPPTLRRQGAGPESDSSAGAAAPV